MRADRHSPSVKRAFPPVGWHRTVEHEPHRTTDDAWEKTVVMLKQPVGENEEVSPVHGDAGRPRWRFVTRGATDGIGGLLSRWTYQGT